MLPLHHDPGRDTSCRGMRLIQFIASLLVTSPVRESGRPDSNRRSQAPRACGLARLSHALIGPASSPCGNRTHLSALKGRCPQPIDERADFRVGRGALESPSAGLQPAARPSQLPTRSAVPTKKARCLASHRARDSARGCPWPGVTSARDRARASSPRNRRNASLRYNPGGDADSGQTWTTSVRSMSQADSTRGRPCGPATALYPYRRGSPGRMFAIPTDYWGPAGAGRDGCLRECRWPGCVPRARMALS